MQLIDRIERYYDAVPRATADALEVGPFTMFVAREGWPYYARPRLGENEFTSDDVTRVVREQRERQLPASVEWVHEVTPALLAAAHESGLDVEECPLLVLESALDATIGSGMAVEILSADDPRLGQVLAAIEAGFSQSDTVRAEPVPEWVGPRIQRRLLSVAGAFAGGAVGGGSHAVRGGVSELTGIAVLPRHRRRGVGAALTKALAVDAMTAGATTVFLSAGTDEVARVYERVGFRRVGTACMATAADREAT